MLFRFRLSLIVAAWVRLVVVLKACGFCSCLIACCLCDITICLKVVCLPGVHAVDLPLVACVFGCCLF